MKRAWLVSVAMTAAVLVLPRVLAAQAAPADEARRLVDESVAAYKDKDYASFLAKNQAALALSPRSVRVLYNLACGYALTGRPAEAVATLDRITARGIYMDAAADSDFVAIKDSSSFKEATSRAAALLVPLASGVEAFHLPEKDLVTEGIAYDPKSGDFFVSSVHKRKIVRVGRNGAAPRDFVREGQDGLWSVLALRVDAPRRLLYATSVAVREGLGYRKEDEGKSALFAFSIDTGRLVRRVDAPADGRPHNLNDVVIDAKGTVFVSDAVSGHLYVLPPKAAALKVLVAPGAFVSPQGLVLSPDGRTLFVADYARGLFRVEVARGRAELLAEPDDSVLAGLDGLVAHGRELIGIQNGVRPHRVVRITLTDDGRHIGSVTALDREHPAYSEPTLGVLVGDDLYYVANSQWGSFTREGALLPLDQMKEPVVLRLRLR